MATIEEVARAAGVSVATVSRVLNESATVKEETADKVRAAIRELNYSPNLSARNLRKNESRVILVLAPNFLNPFYANILTGIGETARESGYSVLIYSSSGDAKNEKKALRMLESHRADGAILLGCSMNYSWMKKYTDHYPIVQCCEYAEELKAPSISIDNYSAAYNMVKHLHSLGHEKIGMVTADNEFISTFLRRTGYKRALSECGLTAKPEWTAKADANYSFASGAEAARALLTMEDRPTALFCISDIIALSVISVASELGIRVPEDLAVSGFDDVDYTTMFHPYLTTVAQPCYDMGCKSLNLLLDIISGRTEMAAERLFVPYTLVTRESTNE